MVIGFSNAARSNIRLPVPVFSLFVLHVCKTPNDDTSDIVISFSVFTSFPTVSLRAMGSGLLVPNPSKEEAHQPSRGDGYLGAYVVAELGIVSVPLISWM